MKLSFWLLALSLSSASLSAEPPERASLLVCGMDEVFLIHATAAEKSPLQKIWSWRAKDHEELPEAVRKTFATTDECKPIEGGKKILISSSSGGCALVERPGGKVLWHARVANAHSIELLPLARVVVAASVSAAGNRLLVFDLAKSNEPLCETPLPSAHGIVWDEARHCLWALGFSELRRYELKDWEGISPSLALVAAHALPDEDGHDLQAVPGSRDLVLSTDHHVYLFDRDQPSFRLHPQLGETPRVKCVSMHPATRRVAFIHGSDKAWWSSTIGLLAPEGEVRLGTERVYKARWLPQATTDTGTRKVTKITSKNAAAVVDTNDAPDLKDWGGKAGTLCVEWFPKIAALLPSEGFTAPKEVTLFFDAKMAGVANASGNKITIAASWVRAHPDDLGMVVHELTHVVQSYPPGSPGWLVEGIADYIRLVHFEPQAPRPQIDATRASYKDAYKTTAMFLEWVEKNHAQDFVRKMNAELRHGRYDDALWSKWTGKSIDELWKQFVQTLPAKP